MIGAFLKLGYKNKLHSGWSCIYGYIKEDTICKYKELLCAKSQLLFYFNLVPTGIKV